jgi:hypothetical protein
MIANALFITIALPPALVFWLMGELKFFIPYKPVLWREYATPSLPTSFTWPRSRGRRQKSPGSPRLRDEEAPLSRSREARSLQGSSVQKHLVAERHGLRVVRGKIPVPVIRIEYEARDGERARVHLELATSHYRGRNLAEKVRAGFSIYAHAEDASKLRRVLGQRELTAEILSL